MTVMFTQRRMLKLFLLLAAQYSFKNTALLAHHVSAFTFHPASWRLPPRKSFDRLGKCAFFQSNDGSADTRDDNNKNKNNNANEFRSVQEWEDSIRDMSAEALILVFYPKYDSIADESAGIASSSNRNNTQNPSSNGMDPEKALKKVLRRYQKTVDATTTTVEERHASRKRLSDLILGTSVMRLRHFYYLLLQEERNASQNIPSNGGTYMNMEPIIGFDLGKSTAQILFSTDQSSGTKDGAVSQRRIKTVRAMVDFQAQYLTLQNQAQNDSHYSLLENNEFQTDSEKISVFYSLPLFFVEMLVEQHGASKTEKLAAVFNQPGPITIRRNFIKCPSDKVLCERLWNEDGVTAIPLSKQPLSDADSSNLPLRSLIFPSGCIRLVVGGEDSWSPSKKSIWSMQAWKDGWFEVQDAGSQWIVEAAEVHGGDVVVDYCAGNGGKTFALASQMHQEMNRGSSPSPRGYVIAHDIVEERLRQLQGSFERIGLVSSKDCCDSGETPAVVKTTLDSGVRLNKGMADVVLVDAPCSSTGVLRRRPSQRFKLKEEELKHSFPSLQLSILNEASELVKPNDNGRLIYATCSICEQENENVVNMFESQDSFTEKWERWDFAENAELLVEPSSNDNSMRHCRTLLPNANDCDGFFMARWRRL